MTEKGSYLRCSAPKCNNPLIGKRNKFYCSTKCGSKVQSLRRSEECKGVYASIDWAGGPRGMISESSIKKEESFVPREGRFSIDDYYVDPEIFEIAVQNHENLMLARAEHEARVVIDGLNIFKESYNEHHETSYEALMYLKHKDDPEKLFYGNATQRMYYAKNKEKINAKARKIRSERS